MGGDNPEAVADLPEPASSPTPRSPARLGSASGLGAFAAIGAALLCLAFSPKANSVTFVPKFAVLLLFAAIGIVPLARLIVRPSPLRLPARAAGAFLVVALVSALASPSPNLGIFGLYLWGTGWLFWLGVAGAFAIGASLGPDDRRWLFAGLLVGALGNVVIAVYQIAENLPAAGLALFDGTQADGLLGNPIHLEALLLGALALVLGRTCRSPLKWGVVVVLLAVGLELTSERFAVLILVLLVLCALYSYGLRRGGIFALLIAFGYGLAYLTGGSGLGSRVTSGTSETTFGVRLRVWVQGGDYVLHHPLLGAGPGQLRTAMDSSATLSFFQHVLAGKILTDGHNIFVEVGVTTGILGLVCFLTWLFGAARTAERCGFLGFAAAMFAVELVEPLNVAVTPLAFLALGAATAVRLRPAATGDETGGGPGYEQLEQLDDPDVKRHGIGPRITTLVALGVALFLGVTMVTGDIYMSRAVDFRFGHPFNLAAAKDANTLLPYWPDSALQVAQVEASDSLTATSVNLHVLADSRHWSAVAVGRDTRNPDLWTLLGGADVELKRYGLARTEYLRALTCDKWFTQALEGLGRMAGISHNWNTAVHWYRLALTTAVHDSQASAVLRPVLSYAERQATGSG